MYWICVYDCTCFCKRINNVVSNVIIIVILMDKMIVVATVNVNVLIFAFKLILIIFGIAIEIAMLIVIVIGFPNIFRLNSNCNWFCLASIT